MNSFSILQLALPVSGCAVECDAASFFSCEEPIICFSFMLRHVKLELVCCKQFLLGVICEQIIACRLRDLSYPIVVARIQPRTECLACVLSKGKN